MIYFLYSLLCNWNVHSGWNVIKRNVREKQKSVVSGKLPDLCLEFLFCWRVKLVAAALWWWWMTGWWSGQLRNLKLCSNALYVCMKMRLSFVSNYIMSISSDNRIWRDGETWNRGRPEPLSLVWASVQNEGNWNIILKHNSILSNSI